jgi:hypothetical protein
VVPLSAATLAASAHEQSAAEGPAARVAVEVPHPDWTQAGHRPVAA